MSAVSYIIWKDSQFFAVQCKVRQKSQGTIEARAGVVVTTTTTISASNYRQLNIVLLRSFVVYAFACACVTQSAAECLTRKAAQNYSLGAGEPRISATSKDS